MATWKGAAKLDAAPWSPVTVAVTENGSQLVGFSAKPCRSSSTWTERSRSGTPAMMRGSGSDTAVSVAVAGSTSTATRTATLPKSYGPDTAGTTTRRLTGAPL